MFPPLTNGRQGVLRQHLGGKQQEKQDPSHFPNVGDVFGVW
jgi:hypothetical protein